MSERPADVEIPTTQDAIRRSRLANERTYLAWWRSALTAYAVALGAGKVIPELASGETTWPFVALGACFAVLGTFYAAYGLVRWRVVERSLHTGTFVPPSESVLVLVTGTTALLGLLAALAIVFGT